MQIWGGTLNIVEPSIISANVGPHLSAAVRLKFNLLPGIDLAVIHSLHSLINQNFPAISIQT